MKVVRIAAIVGALIPNIASAVDTSMPAEFRETYRHLYETQTADMPDGSKSFGEARLWNRHGINVLYLKGDAFEMAFQHGALLKDEILASGSVERASLLVRDIVRQNLGEGLIPNMVTNYVYNNIVDGMLEWSIENADAAGGDGKNLHQAWGMAEATGIPAQTFIRAALGPEALQVLLAESKNNPLIDIIGGGNCSEFIATGSATSSNQMIIARNTDYQLNGHYDAHPTVMYFDNQVEGELDFMGVSSAGLHNAGVQGMNEKGIYVASHTVPTLNASTEGFPIFMVSQYILRKASTMDEALAVFEQFKPAAGWTYVVASASENRVVSVELNNERVAVREMTGDSHTQTNHYKSEAMVEDNYHMNYTVEIDSEGRELRMQQLIEQMHGSIGYREAMTVLGDKISPFTGEVTAGGNTVAVHTTVSSIVIEPLAGRIFVAAGLAPTSQGTFVGLPTIDRFDPATFAAMSLDTVENDQHKRDYPSLASAESHYIEAKKAYEYEFDIGQALTHMEAAIGDSPANGIYLFSGAILALKSGDDDKAEQWLTTLGASEGLAHHRHLSQYYLGLLNADYGRKREARAFLQPLADNEAVFGRLSEAAQKVLDKLSWRRRVPLNRNKLMLFMHSGDMVKY